MTEDADADPAATRAMTTPSRVPVAGGSHKSDGASGSGRLEVRCPNCHAPTEVAVDTTLTDLTCSACGSHFSLVDQSKATRMAPSLSKLGRFELIERLGVGGFGSVWKARDKELDRTVAIKIPRAGAMTAEEQEQFFREARAAAQLRHPRIVSVHEVGRDGDSVYIVSDFVRGVTLSDWLTGQQLTGREAAELCAKIADALHHAHEQGVVHRDLKPANVIVDGDGQPHLMDFGLARRDVGEVSVTMDGQVLGTPAYMSPEQAEGKAHTADRRSDVYSLGVILFQLLTGELPFRGNARMLMHQVIHDEPLSPRKLNANISKDLETMTLKCLEKIPANRYQTAEDFAKELHRFLAGEPIHARPISRIARAWRWAKRRPAAAALLALLVIAAVAFALAFVRERDLRREVVDQNREAERQRVDADQQRAVAESRKAEAESARDNAAAIVKFLTDDVLAKASPKNIHDKAVCDTLVKALIEPAAGAVGQRFKGKPVIEAAVQETLAETLFALGRSDLALPHIQRALTLRCQSLGDDHPDTIDSLTTYASLLVKLGRPKEAEPLFKQALEQRRKVLGVDHRNTISSLNNYAEVLVWLGRPAEAEPLHKQALEQRRKVLGENHPDTITSLDYYAHVLERLGRAQEAEPLFKQALEQRRKVLGVDHPDTIESLGEYAHVLERLGRAQEAEPLFKQALEQRRKVLGVDHPDTIVWLNNYANVLTSLGRSQEAEPLFKQALEQDRKALGEDHPETLRTMSNLALAYSTAGRHSEAVPLSEQALAGRRKILGADHPDTLLSIYHLAIIYDNAGRPNDAIPLYEQTLAARQTKLGNENATTTETMNRLVHAYEKVGRFGDAIPLYEQVLAAKRKTLGAVHHDTLTSMNNLALAYNKANRLSDAIPLYAQVLAARRKSLGTDHADTLNSMNDLAVALLKATRRDEAMQIDKQMLEQGAFFKGLTLSIKIGPDAVSQLVETAVAHRGEKTPKPIDAIVLGELRLVAAHPDLAEPAIRAAVQKDTTPNYVFKSLGWCLLAQGKADGARLAFQEVLKDHKRKDGTYDLEKANSDQLTAAYFLDLVTEQAYVDHFASDKKLACFPWFYVAQRREIEGKKDAAIKGYERCVELSTGGNQHTVQALSGWKLRKLKEPPKAGEK